MLQYRYTASARWFRFLYWASACMQFVIILVDFPLSCFSGYRSSDQNLNVG
jgi:hypothetical protein